MVQSENFKLGPAQHILLHWGRLCSCLLLMCFTVDTFCLCKWLCLHKFKETVTVIILFNLNFPPDVFYDASCDIIDWYTIPILFRKTLKLQALASDRWYRCKNLGQTLYLPLTKITYSRMNIFSRFVLSLLRYFCCSYLICSIWKWSCKDTLKGIGR